MLNLGSPRIIPAWHCGEAVFVDLLATWSVKLCESRGFVVWWWGKLRVVGRLVALIWSWVEHGSGVGAFAITAVTTTATATAAAEAAVEGQEEYDDSDNNSDNGGPPAKLLVRGSHLEEIRGACTYLQYALVMQ